MSSELGRQLLPAPLLGALPEVYPDEVQARSAAALEDEDWRPRLQAVQMRFISFITSEACEKCITDKRKTINGDDLLYSMNVLGFERYI